jgi:hypothetical protein
MEISLSSARNVMTKKYLLIAPMHASALLLSTGGQKFFVHMLRRQVCNQYIRIVLTLLTDLS